MSMFVRMCDWLMYARACVCMCVCVCVRECVCVMGWCGVFV